MQTAHAGFVGCSRTNSGTLVEVRVFYSRNNSDTADAVESIFLRTHKEPVGHVRHPSEWQRTRPLLSSRRLSSCDYRYMAFLSGSRKKMATPKQRNYVLDRSKSDADQTILDSGQEARRPRWSERRTRVRAESSPSCCEPKRPPCFESDSGQSLVAPMLRPSAAVSPRRRCQH